MYNLSVFNKYLFFNIKQLYLIIFKKNNTTILSQTIKELLSDN